MKPFDNRRQLTFLIAQLLVQDCLVSVFIQNISFILSRNTCDLKISIVDRIYKGLRKSS